MRGRCENPNKPEFKDYGGRGITVCARWLGPEGFTNFIADMAPRPDGATLERKRVNEGYSPENCCWATRLVQSNNKRNNRQITWNGETRTLSEWGRHVGIASPTIYARLNVYGWSFGQALGFEPPPPKRTRWD